jgi:hypothetical protein
MQQNLGINFLNYYYLFDKMNRKKLPDLPDRVMISSKNLRKNQKTTYRRIIIMQGCCSSHSMSHRQLVIASKMSSPG